MKHIYTQSLVSLQGHEQRLRVLHVIPSISAGEGGPSAAIRTIVRALAATGVSVEVATTDDDGKYRLLESPIGRSSMVDGMSVIPFPKQFHFYKISLPFRRWLSAHAKDYDLIHIHALFSYVSTSAAHIAHRMGIPYIIRPLGLLNRYGMTQRRPWLKLLAYRLLDGPALKHAACIHYTSEQEQTEAQESGVRTPSRIIPLGIDLDHAFASVGPKAFLKRYPECDNRPLVLFMSRLDPKKGLDILLEAFRAVRERIPNARLVISGTGDRGFGKQLQQHARRLGIADNITWTGFVKGEMKYSALAAASVFVLPSYSENFGIAAVEALAAGLPCVLSENVAVASTQVREADAGLVTACEPRAIADAVIRVLEDRNLQITLSKRAKTLARATFSSETMGDSLVKLYTEIARSRG